MGQKNKLVLVEDEDFFAQSVAEGLQNYNYEVETFNNGENMLEKIDLNPPDAVILDYHLDNQRSNAFNGKQVLEIMRARHPGIPVIMLTNMNNMEEAVLLIKRGAVDFIIKDDNFFDNLREALEKIFAVKGLINEVSKLKSNIKRLKTRLLVILTVIFVVALISFLI